jgi:hypothetical protein
VDVDPDSSVTVMVAVPGETAVSVPTTPLDDPQFVSATFTTLGFDDVNHTCEPHHHEENDEVLESWALTCILTPVLSAWGAS